MRVSIGVLTVITMLLGAESASAQELRADSYRWYFGVTGGGLFAQTQTQDYSTLPSAGIHIMVVGKRGGLMLGVEESFGSNESSGFGLTWTLPDSTLDARLYDVSFDRIRKYHATLMAFPLRGRVEPYLGVGFGIMHTVGTEISTGFQDPEEAFVADSVASEINSTGFGSFVGGVQAGAGSRIVFFGQYQITTAPSRGNLLVGPSHSVQFGLRFSLGKAKEDIRGGGY
jgi:hypothetical protein